MNGESDLNRPALRLFLFGFLILFLELTLIRYLAGNVYNLGYFPNLVLLAVFLGMGAGFLFHRHLSESRSLWYFEAGIGLLLLMVLFVYFNPPVVPGFIHSSGQVGGEVFFSASPRHAGMTDFLSLCLLFLMVATIIFLIAQRTAKFFIHFAPLHAYSLDIGGSCLGIVSFMLMSWFQLPPAVWFLLLAPVIIFLQERTPRALRILLGFTLAAIVFVVWKQDTKLPDIPGYSQEQEVKWSPYQKVVFSKNNAAIFANGLPHQKIVDRANLQNSFYQRPYSFRKELGLPPYKNVLIIGSGSGNDVAAALMNDAGHVDAVEIDPVLAGIGMKHNPLQPYQDPRTRLIVDDGRAFLTQTDRSYDLILFALTDSLVKASPVSQLRLENYLFTEESVRRAFQLLSDDGYLLFYNFYRFPFIPEKIRWIIHRATGFFPVTIYAKDDFAMLLAGKDSRAHTTAPAEPSLLSIPRDDWPFLYLKNRSIPAIYAYAMAGLAFTIFAFAALLQFLIPEERKSHSLSLKLVFVFMGIAFLLLETKSVIQFSLLFGTTWLNNSLVFLAVLLFVLAANWAATLLPSDARIGPVYALLLVSCLLALVIPLEKLLWFRNPLVRFAFASVLTFSPIFFANLIFSMTFRNRVLADSLFGWNLIGAGLGGIVEYSSMLVGYNALAVLVMLCYTAVFLLLKRTQPATNRT